MLYQLNLLTIILHTYIWIYPKINIHPRCFILDALHELTPESAGQQLAQKLYENHILF